MQVVSGHDDYLYQVSFEITRNSCYY